MRAQHVLVTGATGQQGGAVGGGARFTGRGSLPVEVCGGAGRDRLRIDVHLHRHGLVHGQPTELEDGWPDVLPVPRGARFPRILRSKCWLSMK